jgi:hypothetical protein
MLGVRELLVRNVRAKEALALCEVIKQDMITYMSKDSAKKCFENYEDLMETMDQHIVWEPFTSGNDYEKVEIKKATLINQRGQKRSKTTTENKSYANAVRNNKSNYHSSSKKEDNYKQNTKDEKLNTMLEDLKETVLKLEEKHQVIDRKMIAMQKEGKKESSELKQFIIEEIQNTNNYVESIKTSLEEVVTKDVLRENNKDLISQLALLIADNNKSSNSNIQYRMATNHEFSKRDRDGNERKDLRDDSFSDYDENEKENMATGGNQNKCTEITSAYSSWNNRLK